MKAPENLTSSTEDLGSRAYENYHISADGFFADGRCQIVIRGKNLPTVIAFSSVNTPAGRFKPYKIVLDSSVNIIFVNDAGNNWYLRGIGGLGETAECSARALVSIAKDIGNGTVMTFGTSMGAYGAMLYAALGDADICLSFGAELILDMPGSRSDIHRDKSINFSCSSLIDKIKKAKTQFYLYVSEIYDFDLISAATLLDIKNVTLISLRGVEHPAIQSIEDETGVGHFIDSAFKDIFTPSTTVRAGEIFTVTGLVKDLWISSSLMRSKQYATALNYLEVLSEKYCSNAVYMFRLGEAYYRNNLIDAAIGCWITSIKLDNFQSNAQILLGSVLRRRGDLAEAETHLIRSIEVNPRSPYAHYNLGKVYQDMGEIEKASVHFQTAVDFNSGNRDFQASLAENKALAKTKIARPTGPSE